MKIKLLAPAIKLILLSICLLSAKPSMAQYAPASIRWRQMKSDNVRMIYPRDFEPTARRVMWYLDSVRTHVGYGWHHGTMRTPVVIHTQNMMANGSVRWAPRMMEFLSAPGALGYSEPWFKELAIHEYRHNVQFNNLRQGWFRPLYWLTGELFLSVGNLQNPMWMLEGDAVMAETEMSAFGRGLQPSWTIHYRAAGDVGDRSHSRDYWFNGSFRDHVPDWYHLGYQMARWSYNRFGTVVWDDAIKATTALSNLTLSNALKEQRGMDEYELFRNTFTDLNAFWDSLPRVEDSSVRVPVMRRGPGARYTTWQWPLWVDKGTLVAFKSDVMQSDRIVRVDVASGREEVLTHTGWVSSRPVLAGGVLWWTELRYSTLWRKKIDSRLCSYDLATGEKRAHRTDDQVFWPAPTPQGMAHVAFNYAGHFSIVHGGEGSSGRLDLPLGVEVSGLAWDDATHALYFIGLDDGGMFLAKVLDGDGEGFERLTPSRHISINDLRAGGGTLYFGSIVSGKDEAHAYDLATGTEYRLSTSTYGSFSPSMPAPDGQKIALTTYDRHGYHLTTQDLAQAVEQPQRDLPLDIVNPKWKRWDVPKMDSIVYTPEAEQRSTKTYTSRRYSKLANIFRPHSWTPYSRSPLTSLSESDLRMDFGAAVMSDNLLFDASSWIYYGWRGADDDWRGGGMVAGGISYSGLGPVIDLEASYGGAYQTVYSAGHTPVPLSVASNLKAQLNATARVSMPMVLSSGAWISILTPAAEYHRTNGLIYASTLTISDGFTETITRGVDKTTLSLDYMGHTQMAQGEFLPRWGVSASVGYVTNPFDGNFAPATTASLGLYVPGVVRPHVVTLRAAAQQRVGRADAPLMFRSKDVFPRGAKYDFSATEWRSGSVDYQLPVWYPEGGIPGTVYFKRVRLNLFADYALWRGGAGEGVGTATGATARWNRLYSYGGDIILDLVPLRWSILDWPLRFTFARPSGRRGVWFGFGVDVPL